MPGTGGWVTLLGGDCRWSQDGAGDGQSCRSGRWGLGKAVAMLTGSWQGGGHADWQHRKPPACRVQEWTLGFDLLPSCAEHPGCLEWGQPLGLGRKRRFLWAVHAGHSLPSRGVGGGVSAPCSGWSGSRPFLLSSGGVVRSVSVCRSALLSPSHDVLLLWAQPALL